MIRELNIPELRARFKSAEPFPFVCIDDFLEPGFAREVARSYPNFDDAARLGKMFDATNERKKVQVTDPNHFPAPVKAFADLAAAESFRKALSDITGIQDLLWDPSYNGGGMHQTASSGRLDVHIDFNRLPELNWYRRLNLLLFLNENWKDSWGGRLELWDRDVKKCHHSFEPIFNRCVIFETSDISYHGVTPVSCPPGVTRRSFALYYYSQQPPAHQIEGDHTTIFRARPNEHLSRFVLMPAKKAEDILVNAFRTAKRSAARIIGLRD